MTDLQIHMFPALSDNYGFLIHDPDANVTACVDSPDVPAIEAALEERGWALTHILNTHHHSDHAGGNLDLKDKTGCIIVGAKKDADRLPGIDVLVQDGDLVPFGKHELHVMEVPGHTTGHIAYWLKDQDVAFVGDTLFALGCGRVFEGTHEQMWSSLQKLMALPDETVVYCAHEYTQANAAFALSVEPDNKDLQTRSLHIDTARARNEPTVPTTIALEKATNPFLRPDSANLQKTIGKVGASLVDVFAETRRLKDHF